MISFDKAMPKNNVGIETEIIDVAEKLPPINRIISSPLKNIMPAHKKYKYKSYSILLVISRMLSSIVLTYPKKFLRYYKHHQHHDDASPRVLIL